MKHQKGVRGNVRFIGMDPDLLLMELKSTHSIKRVRKRRLLNWKIKYNVEPLITQITTAFPDIQPADVIRIMDFLGYSTEDIYEPNASYQELEGLRYFIQSAVVKNDTEREMQRFIDRPTNDIQVTVTVTINGEEFKANGTVIES